MGLPSISRPALSCWSSIVWEVRGLPVESRLVIFQGMGMSMVRKTSGDELTLYLKRTWLAARIQLRTSVLPRLAPRKPEPVSASAASVSVTAVPSGLISQPMLVRTAVAPGGARAHGVAREGANVGDAGVGKPRLGGFQRDGDVRTARGAPGSVHVARSCHAGIVQVTLLPGCCSEVVLPVVLVGAIAPIAEQVWLVVSKLVTVQLMRSLLPLV